MILNIFLNAKYSILCLFVLFIYNKKTIIKTRTVNRANIADLVAKIAVIMYVVESNNKKSSFLFRTVHELGLTNVEVISERMENFFLKKTDVEIIARAFGDIDRAISTSSYYLDRGALLRLMKTNSQKQKIGKKLSKKYQIISTENIYSELRSQNILITVGSKCNKQEGN